MVLDEDEVDSVDVVWPVASGLLNAAVRGDTAAASSLIGDGRRGIWAWLEEREMAGGCSSCMCCCCWAASVAFARWRFDVMRAVTAARSRAISASSGLTEELDGSLCEGDGGSLMVGRTLWADDGRRPGRVVGLVLSGSPPSEGAAAVGVRVSGVALAESLSEAEAASA